MITILRITIISSALIAPLLAFGAKTQLIGVGAISCKEFKAQASAFKKLRESVAKNRKLIGNLAALTDEQNQDLSQTYADLYIAQDTIDTWFEMRFNEYARGMIQRETEPFNKHPSYKDIMIKLHTHRFVLDFDEFCTQPVADNIYFYTFIDVLTKGLKRNFEAQ